MEPENAAFAGYFLAREKLLFQMKVRSTLK
jgi:hypothetical protein